MPPLTNALVELDAPPLTNALVELDAMVRLISPPTPAIGPPQWLVGFTYLPPPAMIRLGRYVGSWAYLPPPSKWLGG